MAVVRWIRVVLVAFAAVAVLVLPARPAPAQVAAGPIVPAQTEASPTPPAAVTTPTWLDPPLSLPGTPTGRDVAAADVDGDGLTDIVLASMSGIVVEYQGADGFVGAATTTIASSTDHVAVGDIDGDGRADAVDFNQYGWVVLFRSLPGRAFAAPQQISLPARPVAGLVADLNHDGRADVLASTSYGSYALYQQADHTLAAPKLVAGTANATQLHLTDVDGDGRVDLVYVVPGTSIWRIRRQNAQGGFAPEVAVGTAPLSGPGIIAVGDLSGDGRPDLVTMVTTSGKPAVLVSTQQADGSFGPVVSTDGPDNSYPQSVAVADVTGDGAADVVVLEGGGLVVFPNVGGSLGAGTKLFPVSGVTALTMADANGDGQLDAVMGPLVALGALTDAGPRGTSQTSVVYQPPGPEEVNLQVTDPDDPTLSFVLTSPPAHGTVTGGWPTVTYQPAPGYLGGDAFTYRVTDGKRKWLELTVGLDIRSYGQITGVVDDGYDQTIAGITVQLWDVPPSGPEVLGTTTSTGSDGSYAFDRVTVGWHRVRFVDPLGRYEGELWDNQALNAGQPWFGNITIGSGDHKVANASLPPRRLGPIYVTTTAEDGPGSIRQAMGWAHASYFDDRIVLQPGATYTLTCAGGGALRNDHARLTIIGNGSTIRQTCPGQRVIDSLADNGGDGDVRLVGLRLEGGSVVGCGGAVGYYGHVVIDRSTITGNTATAGGGGVCASMIELTRSTVTANSAAGDGGGLAAGYVGLDRSTVDGNSASGTAGGVAASTFYGTGSTVTNNEAGAAGVANIAVASDLHIERTVVAEALGGRPSCAVPALSYSTGASFVDDASCALNGPRDVNGGGDPKLGPLADNGGPTATRLPLAGSPLLDTVPAGDARCTGADQRLAPVPAGAGCDTGAVEAGAVAPPLPPGQPDAPIAAPTGQGARVSWTAPPSTGVITGYVVTAYSFDDPWTTPTCTWTSGPLTCTVTGLKVDATYRFSVHAADAGGNGAESLLSEPIVVAGAASVFHPVTPTRVVDTREGWGPVHAGTPATVMLAGLPAPLTGPVPAGATAVVLNVAVTGGTAGSYLQVTPGGTTSSTATLNFGPNQTIANLVTVPLAGGKVTFTNAVGSVDVVADVVGYYDPGTDAASPGTRYDPLPPARILDSRTANGGWSGPLTAGDAGVRTLQVTGRGGVPATAAAVVMNVTVTEGTAGSYLQVFPTGVTRPTSASLNFAADDTRANLVVAKLGDAGNLSFFNAVGSVDVVADVVGWFDPGAGDVFHPITPRRVLDDRDGTGATGPWGPGMTRSVVVGGSMWIPPDASAVAMNLAATNGTVGSYVTVFPKGTARPTAASLSFGPGETIANAGYAKLGSGASMSLYNELGSVDLIADVFGYFSST